MPDNEETGGLLGADGDLIWQPPPDVLEGGVADPRTRFFDPWRDFDLGGLIDKLGTPWAWPLDPHRHRIWIWLWKEMQLWLEFLQRVQADAAEVDIPDDFVRTRMREFFGETFRPLGPHGGIFTADEAQLLDDWGVAEEDGHLNQDLGEILKAIFSTALQTIIGATIGRFLPGQVRPLAERYAGALADALQVQARIKMDGYALQQWKVRGLAGHLPELRRKSREAFDLSYLLAKAVDVRVIKGLNLGAEVARALGGLVNLLNEVYSDPGAILLKLRNGQNPFTDLRFPSVDRVQGAVNGFVDGLSTIGNFGGLKRVAWRRPSPAGPQLVAKWERHVHFQAFAGPIAAANLPTPLNELYPIAFINAVVVPPWSDYFLVRLDLDYLLDVEGQVGAPADVFRQALEGTASGLISDLRQQVTSAITGGLIPPP